jgi:hypothetical protein
MFPGQDRDFSSKNMVDQRSLQRRGPGRLRDMRLYKLPLRKHYHRHML